MNSTTNILVVGVGGQGTLLASRIIGNAAAAEGYNVKISEVHGMSQRGGSVVTYIRFSHDDVASPIICRGEADVIISFEMLEALRWTPYLKKGGMMITNTRKIMPMPVITGAQKYPEDPVASLDALGIKYVLTDAESIAKTAGNEKAANVALLGCSADYIGLGRDALRQAVCDTVPQKLLDVNLAAFDGGKAAK